RSICTSGIPCWIYRLRSAEALAPSRVNAQNGKRRRWSKSTLRWSKSTRMLSALTYGRRNSHGDQLCASGNASPFSVRAATADAEATAAGRNQGRGYRGRGHLQRKIQDGRQEVHHRRSRGRSDAADVYYRRDKVRARRQAGKGLGLHAR